jgi:hypothetical protein
MGLRGGRFGSGFLKGRMGIGEMFVEALVEALRKWLYCVFE